MNWIQVVKEQGNEKLPEWVLAPTFNNQCTSRQKVLDALYDRHKEVFYELDLMQLRQGNWDKVYINYIIYKRKQ